MNRHVKALTSLAALAILALAASGNTRAAERGGDYRTRMQIGACIAEISRQADYSGASRVVHWIRKLSQRNVAELEITAVTSVYAGHRAGPVREYIAACVTDTGGEVVAFRLRPVE